FRFFLRARRLPLQNPERTSARNHRRAASRERSRLPSSIPVLAQQHRARPAGLASVPTLPLCRRGIPPRQPAAPSRHAPTAAHNTPPRRFFLPSQRRRPRCHFLGRPCPAYAPL